MTDVTRIFINNVDTYSGNALCADLSLQPKSVIAGTIRGGFEGQIPACVNKIVSRAVPSELLRLVLVCDVIVYDLHDADLEELEFILHGLKMSSPMKRPITFILISSLLCWGRTPLDVDIEDDKPGNIVTSRDSISGLSFPKPRKFKDDEFLKRIPPVRFADWKSMESITLALNSKSNLRTIVIGAGIQYGNGERVLSDFFQFAWSQSSEMCRTIGVGNNYIPLVHMRDLARMARFVAFKAEDVEKQYYVAVDHSDMTQTALVDAIVDGFVTKPYPPRTNERIGLEQAVLLENADIMLSNLRFEPSSIMSEFRSWAGEGFSCPRTVQKMAKEYETWNTLKPLKLMMCGPNGSYQLLMKSISTHLNIPILTIKSIVTEFLEQEEAALELENSNKEEEEEPAMLNEFAQSVKDKGEAIAGEPLYKLVRQKLKSKSCHYKGYILDSFPATIEDANEMFSEMVQVEVPADPTASADSAGEGGEGEAPPEPKYERKTLDECPELLIKVNLSADLCAQELELLGADAPVASNYEAAFVNAPAEKQSTAWFKADQILEFDCTPLLEAYQAAGAFELDRQKRVADPPPPIEPVMNEEGEEDAEATQALHDERAKEEAVYRNRTTLNEKLTEIKRDAVVAGFEKALEGKLQREMRFFQSAELNLATPEELAEIVRTVAGEKVDGEVAGEGEGDGDEVDATRLAQEEEEMQAAEKLAKANAVSAKYEKMKQEESQQLETLSEPLREYMHQYITPTVTEALIEICRVMPEDPVDYLAEFLFSKSEEVPSLIEKS